MQWFLDQSPKKVSTPTFTQPEVFQCGERRENVSLVLGGNCLAYHLCKQTTLNMVLSVTYYSELRYAITISCICHLFANKSRIGCLDILEPLTSLLGKELY